MSGSASTGATIGATIGAVSVDAFLGGKVEAVQPRAGHHRSGLEAVLLSAAIEASFSGLVVDLGAGAGVAGLCIAARCAGARVLLVERDAGLVACARETLALPANAGFAARIEVAETDIAAPEASRAAAGLGRAVADAVVMNPPFNADDGGTRSPKAGRAAAHVLSDVGLEPWLRAAASALKPGGRLVVIFRADGLDDLLAALRGRFGDVAILPVHARAGKPAHRVLVAAIKGSRAKSRILPPLAIHGTAGSTYLPPVEAILRDGRSLAEAHPPWGGTGEPRWPCR
jgi:tRNA1(Val) A37 N6-methylase TrmN6